MEDLEKETAKVEDAPETKEAPKEANPAPTPAKDPSVKSAPTAAPKETPKNDSVKPTEKIMKKTTEGKNMKGKRVLASFINFWLVIPGFINIILWCFNKEPLGSRAGGTEWFKDGSRWERLVFGLFTLLIFGTVIGFIVNIFFWAKDKDSLPVMITKAIFKK